MVRRIDLVELISSFSDFNISKLQKKTKNMRQKDPPMGKRLFFYSIYAWGVPLLIVMTGQILQNVDELPSNIITPGLGLKKCWFGKRSKNIS